MEPKTLKMEGKMDSAPDIRWQQRFKNYQNKISRDLDDQLIPNAIDLCIYNNIDDPDVLEHIHRVGKIVYSRDTDGG